MPRPALRPTALRPIALRSSAPRPSALRPTASPSSAPRALVAALVVLAAAAAVLLGPAAPARAADPTPDAQNAVNQAAAAGYRSAIAVVDNESGRIWGAGDVDAQYVTESLVKLFIATRLLAQGQMSGFNETTAYKMITQSDDASANTLYGRVGGDGILPWTAQRYGIANLGAPPPSPGYWGATRITARGLAQYYYAVRWDPVVWPWLSNALHHATPNGSDGFYQFFGIPSATTGFGVKQGWGDDTPSGVPEQNSTGVIDGDRFAIVILTQGPGYGGALSAAVTAEARALLPGGMLTAERFGVVDHDGRVLAKDGTVNSPLVTLADGGRQLATDGDRIGVVDAKGRLRVKEGGLYGRWVVVATDVAGFALTGSRVAVLDTQGRLSVKDGGLYDGWTVVAGGVTDFAADGDRIGVVDTAGTARVKEGPLVAGWTVVAGDATAVSLATARIGVLQRDGSARVKQGAVGATWVVVGSGVRDLQLTRGRVAVTTADNAVLVKDGGLDATFVTVAVNVAAAVVRDTRVAVVGFDDQVLVKEGFVDAAWITLYAPGTAVALA